MFILSRFFDVRPGELARVGIVVSLLFFLIAAHSVIKVVRDSIFLSYHSINELPYVYLSVALIAGSVMAAYTRYAAKLSPSRLILSSYASIILAVIAFWHLITSSDSGWAHYAFYVWSAIVVGITVAQFWVLTTGCFTPREARRLFGMLTAGGTLGGIAGSLSAKWAAHLLIDTTQLLWLVAALFAGAFGIAWLATRPHATFQISPRHTNGSSDGAEAEEPGGIFTLFRDSRYLQGIAFVVFLSVVVSTLIDFQFKAAASQAYASRGGLTEFFGSYYAWANAVTFFVQVFLTSKFLKQGLFPNLFLLPLILLSGSLGIVIWPGLLTPTITKVADVALRPSVNRSIMEILYFPIPKEARKRIKVFLDVTVERVGDASAGFIILAYTLVPTSWYYANIHYVCVVLILLWSVMIPVLRRGYVNGLRSSLAIHDLRGKRHEVDFANRQAGQTVLKMLANDDERTVLFGLELAEKLDSESVPHLLRNLLRHLSPAVRGRALRFFARHPDPTILPELTALLRDKNQLVRAEAIYAVCGIMKKDAIPIIRPYLENSDPQVKRAAIVGLLHYGNTEVRQLAIAAFRTMVNDRSCEGEKGRREAARLMGECDNPEFPRYLRRLIREDSSVPVIREAISAAGKRKYPALIRDLLLRLDCKDTKREARWALIGYGEIAVEELKRSLFNSATSRDIRLDIPRVLSKIGSKAARDALLAGLTLQDESIRDNIIVALEEMAHRFPLLDNSRQRIESAMVSEAKVYYRRSAALFVLFDHSGRLSTERANLLREILLGSMEDARGRILRLLSLIYSTGDIQLVRASLQSQDAERRAYGIEFLDHLLSGDIKHDVFPVFDDTHAPGRFENFLELLRVDRYDPETALQDILRREHAWLRAAAVWEIGVRRLRKFRGDIQRFVNSDHSVLREAAEVVITKI